MITENSKRQNCPKFIILEEMKNINLPYDSLKPIEEIIDTVCMFQKLKEILNDKNSDWTNQIGVINYLRRIHKFEKSSFYQFFFGAKIYQKIIDLINSVRSSVSKNVLVLLNEIFSENIPENKNSIITLLKLCIPCLISKINSNQSFIKIESKVCLDSIIKNMLFFEVLLIFLQLLSNKTNSNKEKDNELLAELIIKLIKNLGKDKLVENTQFNELIKYIISFYEINEDKNVKISKNILDCLVEVMTKDNFNVKIEKCGKKEKDSIQAIMKTKIDNVKKKRGTVSSMHFRKVIHERKKSYKLSKCPARSFDKGNKSVSIKISGKNKVSMITNTKPVKIKNDENVQKNN